MIITAVTLFGSNLSALFENVASRLEPAAVTPADVFTRATSGGDMCTRHIDSVSWSSDGLVVTLNAHGVGGAASTYCDLPGALSGCRLLACLLCWPHGVKVDEVLICAATPDQVMARMKADNMALSGTGRGAETDPYGFKSQIVEVADVITKVASDPSSAPFVGAGDEDTTALVGFYHHGFIDAQYRNFEDFGDGFYSGAILARDIAEALLDMRNRAVADYIKAHRLDHRPDNHRYSSMLFVRLTPYGGGQVSFSLLSK